MADPQTIKTTDDYTPRWRHFSPSDIVYVQNPFDHDVTWEVYDDERKRQVRYKIPANERAELTGGLVHTLGVKAIVDEKIQQDGKKLQIWDPLTREKYESEIILKVKASATAGGTVSDEGVLEVNLAEGKTNAKSPPPPGQGRHYEPEFPDLVKEATKNLPKKAEIKEK